MIVGTLKPIEEIADSISEFRKVLIIGCGGCVSVCLTGGEKAADGLALDLGHAGLYENGPPEFIVKNFLRQCEPDLMRAYLDIPQDVDAILSLACGAGVQTMVDVVKDKPIIPAINTSFLGALEAPGVWKEKCQGCGHCVLFYTGGICPITRCAKKLMNGPCGGSRNGRCEINPEVDCAWQLIIDRLKALGRLDDYEKILPPKDWSKDRGMGPRSMVFPA
ncbi:MAG: methylenetetrahydrofolate reductase C-terminal domain-containing protein [Deltaproteobacteria bacterium]|nr:methylenetetrahydrofolate reductase C-terminal domain-containing protein [Deltaproteobacteria bacterium]